MTERKHELTEDDIEWLGNHASHGSAAELLAALPSRQPKDPDAGLGAQPWRISDQAVTSFGCIRTAADETVASVWNPDEGERYDPAAVARTILAAPKAMKLARKVEAKHAALSSCPSVSECLIAFAAVRALAAEVIAIADGEVER